MITHFFCAKASRSYRNQGSSIGHFFSQTILVRWFTSGEASPFFKGKYSDFLWDLPVGHTTWNAQAGDCEDLKKGTTVRYQINPEAPKLSKTSKIEDFFSSYVILEPACVVALLALLAPQTAYNSSHRKDTWYFNTVNTEESLCHNTCYIDMVILVSISTR